MRYKLIIKWFDGEYENHYFKDEQDAIDCANGYLKAFGNQIAWYGINPVRSRND